MCISTILHVYIKIRAKELIRTNKWCHRTSLSPSSPPTVHRTASLPPALSTSSTLMIVLDTCTPLHHLLTLDTLMYLKKDVCTDILSLVAYGTPPVRESALKLLLHYWPLPSDFSRNIYHYGGTYEMCKFFMIYMAVYIHGDFMNIDEFGLLEYFTDRMADPQVREPCLSPWQCPSIHGTHKHLLCFLLCLHVHVHVYTACTCSCVWMQSVCPATRPGQMRRSSTCCSVTTATLLYTGTCLHLSLPPSPSLSLPPCLSLSPSPSLSLPLPLCALQGTVYYLLVPLTLCRTVSDADAEHFTLQIPQPLRKYSSIHTSTIIPLQHHSITLLY